MKEILEKEKIKKILKEKENDEKTIKNNKKNNFLKIFSIVLLSLLIVAIIVEVILIIVLNNKIDRTQDEIDKIPTTSETYENQVYEISEYNPSNNLTIYLS